jgi:CheY-like chemotaxis protein
MLGTTALAGSSALPPLPRFPMNKVADNMERPLVLIVDDDEEMRSALEELLLSVGIDACCFGSTQELLHADLPERPGCLILDVRMPGASGLDLQQQLALNGSTRPVIFPTGHGDIAMTVQAMKAGAVCLTACTIGACSLRTIPKYRSIYPLNPARPDSPHDTARPAFAIIMTAYTRQRPRASLAHRQICVE